MCQVSACYTVNDKENRGYSRGWSRVGMFGVNTERKIRGPVREMRAGRVWGAARCLPRGQGLCSRTVAMSQALEDRATTPRWRVLPQIVLSGVGG